MTLAYKFVNILNMISVVMLVQNNEDMIEKTLNPLKRFDEVVLIDTGSSDRTLKIAKKFPNIKVFSHPFECFGKLRNFGAQKAKNGWILALDTDEILSHDLVEEILHLHLNLSAVYSIPFRNFFKNRWIKTCGWHPESHIRLYHKEKTNFSEDFVHERLIEKGLKICRLHAPIYHYSYRNIDDFLVKMRRYSSLFAKQHRGVKKSSFFKALMHGIFAFFKSFILKKGFLDRSSGFIISIYQANTAFYKYLKLSEANKKKKCS